MNRRGMSLIEVLVSISIISVLMALLLNAVQAVRSAATSLSCKNNIKQLALANHQYHDVFERLPPAMTLPGQNPPSRYHYLSWRGYIAPFIEQDAIYQHILEDYEYSANPFIPGSDNRGLASRVKIMGCPSDDRTFSIWDVTYPSGRVYRVGLASYLGVSGTLGRDQDGVMVIARGNNFLAIQDGLSNTVMIGERPPSTDLHVSWWAIGAGSDRFGVAEAHLGVTDVSIDSREYAHCAPEPERFRPGTLLEQCDMFHYWSTHAGGANFAFADGRVQFIRYEAANLMPALATRAGGEVASLD
jgi:prepilin-type N-terminal cleavage/methylation domain-containing protein/prepilin-type processing-associated H-X9-DG protein